MLFLGLSLTLSVYFKAPEYHAPTLNGAQQKATLLGVILAVTPRPKHVKPIVMLALRRSEFDLQFPLFVVAMMLYC